MSVINTNTASNIAQNAIRINEQQMSVAMERLSTGSRINSAKDDAAGLAISERMSSQISGLNMATRNANDAISMLQTIEGATKEISNMLGRMRELTVQSASGTYTSTDRAALDLEFGALMDEISRIAKNTEWNGDGVLQGTLGQDGSSNDSALAKTIQIGTDSGQTMALSIKTWVPTVASADTDNIGVLVMVMEQIVLTAPQLHCSVMPTVLLILPTRSDLISHPLLIQWTRCKKLTTLLMALRQSARSTAHTCHDFSTQPTTCKTYLRTRRPLAVRLQMLIMLQRLQSWLELR